MTSDGQVDSTFRLSPNFYTLSNAVVDDITTSHSGTRIVVVGGPYAVRYLG
jgi:hypothetical protein